MRMPKTADLGTQALLVVNSFKLHLNSYYASQLGLVIREKFRQLNVKKKQ